MKLKKRRIHYAVEKERKNTAKKMVKEKRRKKIIQIYTNKNIKCIYPLHKNTKTVYRTKIESKKNNHRTEQKRNNNNKKIKL